MAAACHMGCSSGKLSVAVASHFAVEGKAEHRIDHSLSLVRETITVAIWETRLLRLGVLIIQKAGALRLLLEAGFRTSLLRVVAGSLCYSL